MMYKYLIFDLDDTLLDFLTGEHEGLVKVMTDAGITDLQNAMEIYAKINRGLWQAYENGEISKQEIQATRFPKLLETLNVPGDGLAMERAYRVALNHNEHVLPGAEDLLKNLHQTTAVLIAGTNGETETQKQRLELTGFNKFFDRVYISDEVGSAKPSPAFYKPIFATYSDMTTDNTLMIGDGIASDMKGGQAVGLDTVWVNFKHDSLPDDVQVTYEVESMEEMRKLLQDLVK